MFKSSQEFGGFEGSQPSGGGFLTGDSGSSMDSRMVYAPRPLLPVTIKQLVNASNSDANDSKFKIDDKEFMQCKIVGQIMMINRASTTTNYTIDDGTGSISVRMFVSNDDDDAMDRLNSELVEYTYVRVIGRLTEYQNARSINCFHISPITDFNEVTKHRLEAIYAHLVNTKGYIRKSGNQMQVKSSQGMGMGMGFGSYGSNPLPNQNNISMDTSMSYDHGFASFTPVQGMVYNVFASSKDNSRGITMVEVAEALPRVPKSQVMDAIQFLANEGHVFTTIDDDHYSLCM
jgi:replication factor A2